jgi:hypothetical protein
MVHTDESSQIMRTLDCVLVANDPMYVRTVFAGTVQTARRENVKFRFRHVLN